jgi:hypothetical protein
MVRKILQQNFRVIFKDCPNDIKPKFNSIMNVYTFKNGSELSIETLDSANVDNIRGGTSHLSIIDEAAYVDDLEYAINYVIRPMSNTTEGKILIVSTPPTTTGHYFETIVDIAKKSNSYIKKTIYDWFEETKNDPEEVRNRIKRRVIEDTKISYGGETSMNWRVEYLCEVVKDYEDKIIPEFNDEAEIELLKEHKRPSKYESYVSLDLGFTDHTGALFAYYDFREDLLVIEDEYWIQGKKANSAIIAEDIKRIERTLWSDTFGNPIQPFLRVADDDMMVLNDLNVLHGLVFLPTKKDNKSAAINETRIKVANRRIRINPKCVNLLNQLRLGRWNKQRTSFSRLDGCGHFDLIDALIYLVRNVQYNINPYFKKQYFDDFDQFYKETEAPVSKDAKVWATITKPWGKLKRK